jgi:hypothetical protein
MESDTSMLEVRMRTVCVMERVGDAVGSPRHQVDAVMVAKTVAEQ